MKVSTVAVRGEGSKNLIKVAENVVDELENPDFSILYTTKPVNDEIIREVKSILDCPVEVVR